jgi:hypothetical protein
MKIIPFLLRGFLGNFLAKRKALYLDENRIVAR